MASYSSLNVCDGDKSAGIVLHELAISLSFNMERSNYFTL
jgi:hypothetical protein